MRVAVALIVLTVIEGAVASAQWLPSEPVSLGNGRVVLGAEATATIGPQDPGFFNYTDYEYNALRNVRVGVSAQVRASERFQILGELRMDHGDALQPFALFARIRPWPTKQFDIQVGRIPPTFGAFGRRAYGTGNLLIGIPLAYQYLTSLRPDALPATTGDLLRMRGRGWLSNFPVGNHAEDRGLPLINSFRWDTGVQAHGVNGMLEWTAAITTGSLSNPRVSDDNGGRQVAARAVLRPTAPLAIGGSLARGAYLSRSLAAALKPDQRLEDGIQTAAGLDGEFSQNRFLVRGEAIWSRWTLPVALTSTRPETLDALSVMAEGRYRILPGTDLAVRAERLGFERLRTATSLQPWEAAVRRVEIGASYAVVRNVLVKGSWQRNLRDGGRVRTDTLGAMQVVYWF
jgi:hypothetical protein